jgi:hypothetical protein
MAITRLGLANPVANDDVALATFSAPYLVSVTAANKSVLSTPVCKVSIYVVPNNAVVESQYAYVAYNITIGVGQSFETFRFATNAGDTLFVRATTADVSFAANGVEQNDVALPENTAQTFTNKVIRGDDNTLYLAKGTTAQRPASAEVGYVRFNTEYDRLEVKTSTGWQLVGWSA